MMSYAATSYCTVALEKKTGCSAGLVRLRFQLPATKEAGIVHPGVTN